MWQLIESQTLGSSVASVTLGNGGTLPQTYKTLKLVMSVRGSGTGGQGILIQPNGSTTNQMSRYVEGNGATAYSGNSTSNLNVGNVTGTGDTSSTFSSIAVMIPNYAGSTNKPLSSDSVTENNATTAYQTLIANLWSNTAAITYLTIVIGGGTSFVSGSTFTLYGLR